MTPPLIVIVGPTASGKTDFAIEVAKKYNGEIICADSRTVYRYMDIGTAKPSHSEMQAIKHHLIDVVDPNENFNASDFKKLANLAINDIATRGKLPIMVGGTGLYVDGVIFDYKFGPPADPAKRKELESMSTEQLQKECFKNNIELPINKTNRRHLIRALELGGLKNDKKELREKTIVVGISTQRDILLQRVTKRASQMFEDGVLEEAKDLGPKYGWDIEAMSGNVYRILKRLINGEIDRQEAEKLFIVGDMKLAKRQLTWFKRNKHILWGNKEELQKHIDNFISRTPL